MICKDTLRIPLYEIVNIAVEAGIRLDELSLGRFVFHQQKNNIEFMNDDPNMTLRILLQNLRKIDLNGNNVHCGGQGPLCWNNEWTFGLLKMLESSSTIEDVTLSSLPRPTMKTIAQYTWPRLRKLKLDYLEVSRDNMDDLCSLCKPGLEVLVFERVVMHTALWRRLASFLVSNCRLKSVQAISVRARYREEDKDYTDRTFVEQIVASMLAPQVGEEIISETAKRVHDTAKASVVRKSM